MIEERYSKTRVRSCCPKCHRLSIQWVKKQHTMRCNICGAEWHKSMTAHIEHKTSNPVPTYLKQIAKRKAAKKARQTAGEVTT